MLHQTKKLILDQRFSMIKITTFIGATRLSEHFFGSIVHRGPAKILKKRTGRTTDQKIFKNAEHNMVRLDQSQFKIISVTKVHIETSTCGIGILLSGIFTPQGIVQFLAVHGSLAHRFGPFSVINCTQAKLCL